jgi:hypothetical protein
MSAMFLERNQINTTPISQFAQLLRATELAQQKEVKMPIQQDRLLNLALTELLDQVNRDYGELLESLKQQQGNEVITVNLDGGFFGEEK